MATVYKAYDTRLEREVAIKAIRREAFPLEQLNTILKRFEREAKSLGGLSHPNIVGVIDYGEYEGAPYLVMVYLPGGTLKDRLGQPMYWRDAVKLIIPIARALEYTHEHNIINRDIKPSNILMTEKGQPMLTDFGLVKIFEDKASTNLTASGAGLGTPDYMAPEQWTGEATAQSDLYSLGVVLYEMITGHRPYTSDTPAGVLLKQVSEPLPLPKQYVPNLPHSVEAVLLKVLAREPRDRYPDMRSFTDELQNLLDGVEVTATTIATKRLREQMTGRVDSQPRIVQNKVGQIPVEQGRINMPPPAPVKTKRGNKSWVVAGSIGIGLCICLALGSVGLLFMNGFGDSSTSPSATSVPPPQKTNTAVPTGTALPLVTVSGCTSTDDCPDVVWITDLFKSEETQEYNKEYGVAISPDKKVGFFSGWCAVDRKTLDENLTDMEFVFTVDGKSRLDSLKKEYYDTRSDVDSTKQMSCYGIGGTASGWQKGHTYRVEIGQVFKKQVFDGWDTFPEGKQLRIYLFPVK